MIQRIKIKHIYSATALIVLGGFLVTGATAFAAIDDLTPNTSSALPDNSKDSSENGVGTAMGSPDAQDMSVDQDNTTKDQPAAPHHTVGETAAKILDAISKHPTGREGKLPAWRLEQDKAVVAARAGHYDQALPMLEKLHAEHPQELGISTDYAAILGWAGRDSEAVAAYQALPAPQPGKPRPDYLIDSIGHAYRNLHRPEDALGVYRLGLQTYPDNQSFLAGEILSLLDAGHLKEAKQYAQAAADKYPAPSDDLTTAIKLTFREDAVALGRAGNYKEALAAFAALHAKYPGDNGVTGDYVAVLSWAGHDNEAVTLYRTMPQEDQPDYVLDAAAHSYRNLHQPQAALDLYQAALKKDPDNIAYAVGVIYSLSDLGRDKDALAMAKEQMARHPGDKELAKAYVYVERRRAIDLARAGHYEQALALLRELRAKYPSDITEVMDYIAVSSWAGHDADAVHEYEKIKKQPMPDYVLEAVGGSYRKLGYSDKALAVYRRGLKQSPRNEIFVSGEIRCLDDLKRYAEGEDRAKGYTRRYGDHLEVLLAGGEASNFNEDAMESLVFYEHAQKLSPRNREALRGLIHAEDHIGASQLALMTADKHPGLMKADEYRAMLGDADETLVRWGPLEPASEATRYAETDQALARLDAHISQWTAMNDPSVYPSIQRARFDRLVALRDRTRMAEVVENYNALVQDGVEVPPYALEAVGEAYLYLREPEIARDIFLKVLQSDPNDFETRRLLAYAYLEADQYDEAFAAIDAVHDKEPIWVYLKGEPERQPNDDREAGNHAITEVDSAELRMYGDLLQEADDRMTPIVKAAPFDAQNRAAAGNVYFERGWPRQAMEQYQIGLAIQDGHDVMNETGIAKANLELQNFREAEAETQSLMQRFPENLSVQRVDRDLQVHNMAELDAHAGYNFAPTDNNNNGVPTNSPHGQGFDVGAELYSAPIDYNWRLFAGEDFYHEHEPNAEGIIDYSRTNAGAEYRNGDVTASAAPTFNAYNGDSRVGADGKFKYTFNDQWSAGIAAELFSPETPLRALDARVTADRYDGSVVWRQSESRQVTFDTYVMPFSDNNLRTVQEAEMVQRLYTDPNFKLDAEGNLAGSQNSKNEARNYYNPSLDLTFLAGLRATQTLYHRYETLYEHSLLVLPGLYSEQHFGTTPAWVVRYEHRLHYNDTLNAGIGVNYAHQDYDGSAEDAVSLTVDVVERF